MEEESGKSVEAGRGYSFGTFKGVFTPSVLTILGVVMYLRFGWALGNVGLPMTIVIITLASAITFLTGLSLAALATNRRVEGGGAYFIISRSLGVEAGAAVGVPLFFAQALGISFYVAGFCEAVFAAYPDFMPHLATQLGATPQLVDFVANHGTQILGALVLTALTTLAYVSADLALRSQFVIMALIAVSLISFFAGQRPSQSPVLTLSAIPPVKSFWPVFAVIFPAVTGIEAGIAMSGDLKSPETSLPRGTIAAVLFGYAVYIAIVVSLAFAHINPDALRSHPMIMQYVARWGRPVLLGVWAASLSSAMGALLGAPRTLQALAKDRVLPRMFARGYGPGNDPRVATATAFLVGLLGILLGDLNKIAPVLSMFFLTSYGLLNTSAALEELTNPPSWRPKFRVPWPVSFVGAFGCFAAMFMINAGATFLAAGVSVAVFAIMQRRRLRSRWGDVRNGILSLIARYAILALGRRQTDERTWKPNILVLSGSPTQRWHLIDLASAIARDSAFLTVAAVVPMDTAPDRLASMQSVLAEYLDKRDVQAIAKLCPAPSVLSGARMLVTAYGYGPITPNTVILGQTANPENYEEYGQLVTLLNNHRQNLVIVREGEDNTPFQSGAQIDIWWYGSQQNLGLMLALGFMLKQSEAWRGARMLLKTLVAEESEREPAVERLQAFIDRTRIDAAPHVGLRREQDVFEDIRRLSQGADLVFLGMRPPTSDPEEVDYASYHRDLLRRTEGLPPSVLVLAAEDVDFLAIFNDSRPAR